MKIIIFIFVLLSALLLNAETLFEVKDAQDSTVFSISDDGMRVFNLGDTLMVITTSDIKAYIGESKDRALSRSFSISTNTTGKGYTNAFEVGSDSTKIGTSSTTMRAGGAGRYTAFGLENMFIGLNSGISATPGLPEAYSGKYNVFLGNDAGASNTSGFLNTFSGYQAGMANTEGNQNSFYGFHAGYSATSGTDNVFIGTRAGYSNSTGSYNVSIGNDAGSANSGTGNVNIGNEAGMNNKSIANVFIGTSAGKANSDGAANTFIGNLAGAINTTGTYNTYMGWTAGASNNGSNNTFLGTWAGWNVIGADNNVYLGYFTGKGNDYGDNNVFIGSNVNVGGSDKLAIDNMSTSTPLIYGDFGTNALTINGTLLATGNTGVGGNLTITGSAIVQGSIQTYSNALVAGTLTTGGNATINGFTNIVNDADVTGAKGLVIDTDGEWGDIPLRIRTNATASGWTDDDTQFIVWGDGCVESKSIKINSGTEIYMTQSGTIIVGTHSGGVKTVTKTFDTAFTAVPKINVTAKGDAATDVYAVTTRNVTTTSFQVNIYRVDNPGGGWGQNLKIDWFGWQQ
ncbi:MAG: hypothetical protein GQ534_07585 [Candidatus Delongbacteria bacterium]|nr:hypothetical protein [Candidatus Delongbacteria bacterium]